jgi:hypothetical protein
MSCRNLFLVTFVVSMQFSLVEGAGFSRVNEHRENVGGGRAFLQRSDHLPNLLPPHSTTKLAQRPISDTRHPKVGEEEIARREIAILRAEVALEELAELARTAQIWVVGHPLDVSDEWYKTTVAVRYQIVEGELNRLDSEDNSGASTKEARRALEELERLALKPVSWWEAIGQSMVCGGHSLLVPIHADIVLQSLERSRRLNRRRG